MVLQLGPLHISMNKGSGKDISEKDKRNQNNIIKKCFFILYRPGHQSPEFLIQKKSIVSTIRTFQKENSSMVIEEIHGNNMYFVECVDKDQKRLRFSCTYDGGEVWTGMVVSINRDSVGLPIWSGATVIWDVEATAALIEGREPQEDYLNEWELDLLSQDEAALIPVGSEEDLSGDLKGVEIGNDDGENKKVIQRKKGKRSKKGKGGNKSKIDVNEVEDKAEKSDGEGCEIIGVDRLKRGVLEDLNEVEMMPPLDEQIHSESIDTVDICMDEKTAAITELNDIWVDSDIRVDMDMTTIGSLRRSIRAALPTNMYTPLGIDSISKNNGSTDGAYSSKYQCKKCNAIYKGQPGLWSHQQVCKRRPSDHPKLGRLESKVQNKGATDPCPSPNDKGSHSMSDEEIIAIQSEWLNYQTLNLTEYFLSLPEYEAFSDQIDPLLAPDYDLLIGVNINLELMKERSQNCYYRQPQAYLADMRTIFLNAVFFNGTDSPLALRAGELYRAVLKALCTVFPIEDFKDYIAFDECLRDMVPVRSLIMNHTPVLVTAGIDEVFCEAMIEEYDTILKDKIVLNNLKLSHNNYGVEDNHIYDKTRFRDDNYCDKYDSDDEIYLYLIQENCTEEL
jgi:hypothetical protein